MSDEPGKILRRELYCGETVGRNNGEVRSRIFGVKRNMIA